MFYIRLKAPRCYSGFDLCAFWSSSFMQKAKCDGNMIDLSSSLSDPVTQSNWCLFHLALYSGVLGPNWKTHWGNSQCWEICFGYRCFFFFFNFFFYQIVSCRCVCSIVTCLSIMLLEILDNFCPQAELVCPLHSLVPKIDKNCIWTRADVPLTNCPHSLFSNSKHCLSWERSDMTHALTVVPMPLRGLICLCVCILFYLFISMLLFSYNFCFYICFAVCCCALF